jgi:hypothetical protein
MQNLRLRQLAAFALAALTSLGLVQAAQASDSPAALDKAPQTPAMRDSVLTVDSLIASENQQALARAKGQSIAAGFTQPDTKTIAPSGPPPGNLIVQSIYGIDRDLRANLNFNDEAYERVRPGSRIGSCVIAAIGERTVVLKPARKGLPAATCPTGKWTGIPTVSANLMQMAEMMKASAARGGAMPSPAVPTPFSSVGGPAMPFQTAPREPAPLRVNRPTVQLIPSGPMAPGQTSVPLIPRQLELMQDERLQAPGSTN